MEDTEHVRTPTWLCYGDFQGPTIDALRFFFEETRMDAH